MIKDPLPETEDIVLVAGSGASMTEALAHEIARDRVKAEPLVIDTSRTPADVRAAQQRKRQQFTTEAQAALNNATQGMSRQQRRAMERRVRKAILRRRSKR